MKRFLVFLFLCSSLISCTERIVQLAETDNSEITRPTDVSPIYIFYSEEDGSAEFNRNNMIGTTNWLVNIDKRLKLNQILPHLQFLREKRFGDGMHKNEAARNYFSCTNPELQGPAFIDFTDVVYNEQPLSEYLNQNKSSDSIPECYINIRELDKITIGKNFILKRTNIVNLLDDLDDQIRMDSVPNRVYLNFQEKLSFQDYIKVKSEMLKTDSSRVKISSTEFIYK